jgi:hypothetical protein
MNSTPAHSSLAELLYFSVEALNRRGLGIEGSLATVTPLAPVIPFFPAGAAGKSPRRPARRQP